MFIIFQTSLHGQRITYFIWLIILVSEVSVIIEVVHRGPDRVAGQEVGNGVEDGSLALARVPVGDARVRDLEWCRIKSFI